MPQKTFVTNKTKLTFEDKTINGKKVTTMTDPAFIKTLHNSFAVGNNGNSNSNADYSNPKNPDVAFENEYMLLDLYALDLAAVNGFDSGLTGTSLEKFMEFINTRDWSTL